MKFFDIDMAMAGGNQIGASCFRPSLLHGNGRQTSKRREAKPVASTNGYDSVMDCAGIRREFEANERQILVTLKEKDDGVAKNVALGVTGVVLFFPALFFMDPKSPERVEIEALRTRNRVLEEIASTKKRCVLESKLALVYERLDGK